MPQLTECDMIGHCYNPDDVSPRECGRCHEMEKELMEQAVCNGKGSEREAALESKIAKLRYALCAALPFVEDHESGEIYKPGRVRKTINMIRDALDMDEVIK